MMRPTRSLPLGSRLPLLAAVLTAAACGRPGTAGEIARAGGGACPVEEVAVSAAEAELSRVGGLAVDSRGLIHVADVGRMEIVTLRSDGSVLGRRGRAGRGPGEFGDLSGLQVLPGDSVLVLDRQQNRISVFAPDADQPLRSVNLSQVSPFPPPFGIARTRDGTLLVEYRQYYRGDDDPAEDGARRRVFRLLTYEGALLRDSVLVLPEPETDVVVRSGGIVSSMPNPFGRTGPWALTSTDVLVYGWGDSLAVELFSRTGEPAGRFARARQRVQVAPSELRALADAEREPFSSALRAAAPSTWPAFQQLLVDDGDRIWIGALASLDEPTRWLAFDGDGRLQCSASVPRSVHLHQIRDGRAYGVRRDEEDVPHVVVYRIGDDEPSPARPGA